LRIKIFHFSFDISHLRNCLWVEQWLKTKDPG